jgi:hypothetical protein
MINVVTKSQLGGDAKWFLGTDVESETITLLFCLAEAATALKRVTAVVALPEPIRTTLAQLRARQSICSVDLETTS